MLPGAAAVALLAAAFQPAVELCAFDDARIRESSGLAVVGQRLFTHNDSGDTARFFELDDGCRTVGVHQVRGVEPVDWEDVAPGPGGTLWFADTGDNDRERAAVALHQVPVPPVRGAARPLTATTWELRYEDGPHDAEALLVHPRTGEVVVVTRDKAGAAAAYVPAGQPAPGRTSLLRKAGDVAPLGLGGLGGVTGGAVSPGGARVALRTLASLYEWDVGPQGLVAALATEPRVTGLPLQRQGESVAYGSDGSSLLVGTEGDGAPVHLLRRATPTPSPTVSPGASATGPPSAPRAVPDVGVPPDAPAYPTWLPLAAAGGATALAAAAAAGAARRRRGMGGR